MNQQDNILRSLDHIKRAEAPAHFYARVRAGMERSLKNNRTDNITYTPVYISITFFVFPLVNVFSLSFFKTHKQTAEKQSSGLHAFAEEYQLSSQNIGQ